MVFVRSSFLQLFKAFFTEIPCIKVANSENEIKKPSCIMADLKQQQNWAQLRVAYKDNN